MCVKYSRRDNAWIVVTFIHSLIRPSSLSVRTVHYSWYFTIMISAEFILSLIFSTNSYISNYIITKSLYTNQTKYQHYKFHWKKPQMKMRLHLIPIETVLWLIRCQNKNKYLTSALRLTYVLRLEGLNVATWLTP